MNLIKIGKTTINMDQVRCVRDLSPSSDPSTGLLRLEFGPDHCVEIHKHYAPIAAWLNQNSTNLTPGG